MRFRGSLSPSLLLLVLTAVLTLFTPPCVALIPVPVYAQDIVVVNSSGTYLRVPVLETNMSFAGVVFFAYMPNPEAVSISFSASVNANIDVHVYDLSMNLLASQSFQVPANTSASYSIALPKTTTYAVVSLTINGYRVPLFVVRHIPVAEQLPLAGYAQYQALVAMLSGLMVVAPVLGLLLRGMPRAGAVLVMTLSWALLTVMTYFATAVGVDMKLVYAVIGVAFAYSILAFVTYRKG
jgi:hypothetical protein